MAERVLFLARGEATPYGYSWPGRGEDGPHSTPEGVAEAAKLIGRIVGDEGPWVMVEVYPLPDVDVPINEADVDLLAAAVKRHRETRSHAPGCPTGDECWCFDAPSRGRSGAPGGQP